VCAWLGALRLLAVILSINDGGSLLLCVRGVERRLSINRDDLNLSRDDLVPADANAPSGPPLRTGSRVSRLRESNAHHGYPRCGV